MSEFGKDINVPSRKGVFIPDVTVEMLRNASLEGVEDLLASGEMEDISLPSAQPDPDTALYSDGFNDGYEQGKKDAHPDLDEWCDTCREYDSERHCCPRFNRVIRDAVEEVREKIIHCRYCKHWDELLNLCKRTKHMALGVNGFCSKAERKDE